MAKHLLKRINVLIWLFVLFQPITRLSAEAVFPYPIILVHGLDSNDETWDNFNEMLSTYIPVMTEEHVYHAVLNAYNNMTNIEGPDSLLGTLDDDVLIHFYNEDNLLPPGNLYAINFQNFFEWSAGNDEPILLPYSSASAGPWYDLNESDSNESSVYKQGYALSKMIARVLEANDADKVILVGHSMGGLAIREYLQRIENGQRKWWVDPVGDTGHHVAKVVTIGTPHLGSNTLNFPLFRTLTDGSTQTDNQVELVNFSSEAVRDLRYNYNIFGLEGIYLYGGDEAEVDEGTLGYHNLDVNCNGDETSIIVGLNASSQSALPNPDMSLPSENMEYTWITSDVVGSSGDIIVDIERQWLFDASNTPAPFGIADTLRTNVAHWNETADVSTILRGVDEPDVLNRAYQIEIGKQYIGFSTYQTEMGLFDSDCYRVDLNSAGALSVHITNIFDPENWKLVIYNSPESDGIDSVGSWIYDEESGFLNYNVPIAGTYYLRYKTLVHDGSWENPYQLYLNFVPTDGNTTLIESTEYFIDEDPGLGQGVSLDHTIAAAIGIGEIIDLSGIGLGKHRIYIRSKGTSGTWGLPRYQDVFIEEQPLASVPIGATEYYIDIDPGLSSGIQIAHAMGENIDVSEVIDSTALDPGKHRIYTRSQSTSGTWGLPRYQDVYIEEQSEVPRSPLLTHGEYFIDIDPGIGNAQALIFTPVDSVLINSTISIMDTDEGPHNFYLRFGNEFGVWGIPTTREFAYLHTATIATNTDSVFVSILEDELFQKEFTIWNRGTDSLHGEIDFLDEMTPSPVVGRKLIKAESTTKMPITLGSQATTLLQTDLNWISVSPSVLTIAPGDSINCTLDMFIENEQEILINVVMEISSNDIQNPIKTIPVLVEVIPQNDVPVLTVPSEVVIHEDNSKWVHFNVSDEEDENVNLELIHPLQVSTLIEGDSLRITPELDWNGEITLSFLVSDSDTTINQPIEITVLPINDTPTIIINLGTVVIDEDEFGVVVIPSLESYFTDVDSFDVLSFSKNVLDPGLDSVQIGSPDPVLLGLWGSGGTHIPTLNRRVVTSMRSGSNMCMSDGQDRPGLKSLAHSGMNPAQTYSVLRDDGFREGDSTSLVVYPTLNFNGIVRIEITATDDSGSYVIDTLTLDIQAINDAPIFAQTLYDTSMDEDASLSFPLWAVDDDSDSLSYEVYSDTSGVSISYADSTVWIVAEDNWNGSTMLTFFVSDTGLTTSDTLMLTAYPVNDAPESFALTQPETSTIVSHPDSTEQTFIWEAALDVDGDDILYELWFSSNSWDTTILEIDTNQYRLNVEDFARGVDLHWSVIASDQDTFTVAVDTSLIRILEIVGVDPELALPDVYVLEQNYPNPFNPTTTIKYGLPESSDVTLLIYDIRGREIFSRKVHDQKAGWYELMWSGQDSYGNPVASGIYLTRMQAGSYTQVIKMLYLK